MTVRRPGSYTWSENVNRSAGSLSGLLARKATSDTTCSNCRRSRHTKCSGKMHRKYERGVFKCECAVCAARKKAEEKA